MKKKIKAKKVNDFCSVSKFHKWNLDLGESFEAGDVIYILDNLNEKHEIKAEASGTLLEKVVTDNSIVEDLQVLGVYQLAEDNKQNYDPVGVGLISKIIGKIREFRY